MSYGQKKFVQFWRYFGLTALILLGVFSLLGSGGGAFDEEPFPLQDPTGIWYGEYAYWDENSITRIPLKGVVWEGRWMLFSDSVDYAGWDRLYEGYPVVVEQVAKGNFRFYIYNDFYSVSYYEGLVFTKDEISGFVDTDELILVGFVMDYSTLTEAGASLTAIDSNWTEELSSGMTTTLSIDANGVINGSDTNGCVYNGTIQIPDERMNIYKIEINMSLCGDLDGNYSGLGFISGGFQFSVSNPDHFINLTLQRV